MLNFTGLKETEGLGPNSGPVNGAKGLFLHSFLAVRPDGVPEGLIGKTWTRGRPRSRRGRVLGPRRRGGPGRFSEEDPGRDGRRPGE